MDEIFIADEYYKRKRKEELSVGWWWPVIIIGIGSLLYYLVYVNDGLLPGLVPLESQQTDPEIFCSECSREKSRRFTKLGPRIVGTPENEVMSPLILLQELNNIRMKASPYQDIEIIEQRGNGGYHLEYIPPFINIYDNVQNVIAVVKGDDGAHSVLVNCHYDTVEISPGASDDMISCAVMLEVLRILSVSSVQMPHNVVFLFNGAEETYFQGSHLFLQHNISTTCRIVVNMDVCGSGGRNILFQSGPNHPWLLKYYAKYAEHPHGQILGEELFQKGVIPSDSDFRIFRDFGDMPGLDFAFWRNGYVYHTRLDTEAKIPVGSHQNLGDNLLPLVRNLARAPELYNIKEHAEGQMVYYDYLGWFMIYYSNTTSIVLNSLAIVLSACSVALFIVRAMMDSSALNKGSIAVEFTFSLLATLLAMGLAIALPVILALIIDAAGKFGMVWYANPMLIAPFYWMPSVAIYMLTIWLVDLWRSIKHDMPITTVCQMYLVASQIPWIITMIVLLSMGLRSSAILFLIMTSSALANLVIHATPLRSKAYSWIWVYLAIHLPALAYNMYVVLMAYMFFIPIFGRSGAGNFDLSMSLISAICLLYMLSFAIPLIIVVRKPGIIMGFLAVISFIVIIVALTERELRYPYDWHTRPQRQFLMHTSRQFRNEKNEIRRQDDGYFIYRSDANTVATFLQVEESQLISLAEDCDRELLCGLPLYGTRMISVARDSFWYPALKPNFHIETEVTLKDNERNCNATLSTCELTFILKGPDRLTLTFSGRPGASLFDWSFPAKIVPTGEFKGQPAYMVHIVRTNEEDKEISLNFNVTTAQLQGGPILDLGMSGNFIHHESNHSTEFREFINRNIIDNSAVDAWISAYRGYVF